MDEQIMMQLMEITRQLTRIANMQENILTAVSLQTQPVQMTTPEEWKRQKNLTKYPSGVTLEEMTEPIPY